DLIEKAVGLLTGGGDAQWVLFKLDQGLDHILVDEAQDTSPQQWQVIQDLAEEFFVGAGARDESRSIFAVGDEKQSIYSFQGARPEMFSRVGAHFASRVENAGQRFHRIPLTLSFRTVAPVLDAVDTVFAAHERTPGVGLGGQQIRHVANRFGEGGLVELWPTETWAEAEEIELWRPVEGGRPPTPAQRVAENIAGTIRHWLDDGEQLVAEGRAVWPGDVLILVRRRAPFASLMIRALKIRGISVAGADRMRLTEQLAILDLMALGDFLLMPEDDLALGSVLKCPLLGLDDDDLFTLAHDRKGSLWQALLAHRDDDARYRAAVERLEKLRARADFAPPFEFYSLLLGSDGGRQAILARLGPEAGDALDEFLNLAIRYEEEAPPSLQGFSNWLRVTNPEIRRDMDQSSDQVRVMTVHGAKGLEAPIVFLPDTCSGATGGLQATVLALEETLEVLPPVWAIKGAGRHPVVRDARGAIARREREEYHRLLYVAMTRARDRLYIAGFEGRRGRGRDCWYDLASEALTPELENVTLADGREVLRLEAKQTAAAKRVELDLGDRPMSEPLPEWVSRRAKVEKTRAIPITPSRLMPLDGADAAVQNGERSLSPLALAGDARFARGLITHALLQHLPELPPERWHTAAAAFVGLKGQGLSEHARREIVTETLAILEDPQFGFLFGPDSVAEVPLTSELAPTKSGMPVRVNGQVDRLVVGDDQVVIVDYKTNRPPPAGVDEIPRTYLLQLCAYRLALARIYPNHDLRAVLLWTCGPRIMEVPQAKLQGVESDLWRSSHGLDA
ncbi:MAG: double-strand break repair helicase AddA, partial [Hyphomicrobiaceae bacterium]